MTPERQYAEQRAADLRRKRKKEERAAKKAEMRRKSIESHNERTDPKRRFWLRIASEELALREARRAVIR